MPDFEKYLMRHGESWIQSIVEQIERMEGIRHNYPMTLEERWNALKDASQSLPSAA